MSILTVGSSPGRGMRLNLPVAIVPLRRTDNGYWILKLVNAALSHGEERERKHRTPSQQNQVQKVIPLDQLCKSLFAQVIVLGSLFLDKFIQIASVSNGYCRRTLVELVHQACQVEGRILV